MRWKFGLTAALTAGAVAFALPQIASAQEVLNVVASDEIEWVPAPADEPEGVELAVLAGNPEEEGLFVLQLRIPDGTEFPPHSENSTHYIRVLEGNFHIGEGDTIDRSAATALAAGDFVTVPANLAHFAWVEGATIVEVFGLGPFESEAAER